MVYEGVYSMDPDDPGGETVFGISRRHHPSLAVWALVDDHKTEVPGEALIDAIANDQRIIDAAKEFFRSNFWNKIRGDELPIDLAREMYDTAVNMGPSMAVKFLQEAMNLLNNRSRTYADIAVDGKFGPITMRTISPCLGRHPLERLIKVMNILQGARYIELMKINPVNEKFIGWFNRV